MKALQDLNLTVYWLPNPKKFEDLYTNLEAVGKLTGRSAEATKLIESIKARYDAVTRKVAAAKEKPTVFYEIDGTDPTKPWTAGPNSFIDTMLTLAGGQNIGAALKDPFAQISSEELVAQNPAVILLGDAPYGVTVESLAQRPGWNCAECNQKQASLHLRRQLDQPARPAFDRRAGADGADAAS